MKPSLLRKPKILAALVIALLIGAFVLYRAIVPPPPPSYLTATAAREDIADTVLASGTIKPLQQVSVGAQASGQIKSLKVALGDLVKKGQLIAEIDSLPQANELRTREYSLNNLRAQLRAKQASLKQAQLAYERQRQMRAGDASSREDFEAAEAALDTARADIDALQAQIESGKIAVDTARVNLGYTRISSPIDGQVVAVVAQEGQTVNANLNTPTIIKVARMDRVTVKAQISEADVVRVKAGQPVFFTILGDPDHRYDSTLRVIEPAPDSILQDDTSASAAASAATSATSTAIYYNGLLDVPNPNGKLRISMTTQVHIVLARVRQAIVIPSAALGERADDGSYTVQVLDDQGHAQPRQVKIGINTNSRAQVIDGLQIGEKVVIGEATPGAPVSASSEPPRRGPRPA